MNANTQKLPPEGETSDRATADAGANTMWGGRFASGPAAVMERITASIGFDRRLYAQDIAGSKAQCTMMVHQRIIAQTDGAHIPGDPDTVLHYLEMGILESKTNAEKH